MFMSMQCAVTVNIEDTDGVDLDLGSLVIAWPKRSTAPALHSRGLRSPFALAWIWPGIRSIGRCMLRLRYVCDVIPRHSRHGRGVKSEEKYHRCFV